MAERWAWCLQIVFVRKQMETARIGAGRDVLSVTCHIYAHHLSFVCLQRVDELPIVGTPDLDCVVEPG